MSKFIRFTIALVFVLGLAFAAFQTPAYADDGGGTVKNPSGKANGQCNSDRELRLGYAKASLLSGPSDCSWFIVKEGSGQSFKVFFNSESYDLQYYVEACFPGQNGVIYVTYPPSDEFPLGYGFFAQTYQSGTMRCTQLWVGSNTTFELVK